MVRFIAQNREFRHVLVTKYQDVYVESADLGITVGSISTISDDGKLSNLSYVDKVDDLAATKSDYSRAVPLSGS